MAATPRQFQVAPQPTSVIPVTAFGAPPPTVWSSGLCGCFDDCCSCRFLILTLVCSMLQSACAQFIHAVWHLAGRTSLLFPTLSVSPYLSCGPMDVLCLQACFVLSISPTCSACFGNFPIVKSGPVTVFAPDWLVGTT